MIKVVIDTNVFLVSISSRSRLHWILKNLFEKKYVLCVSTEILAEYAEIIESHMGIETSDSILGVIENLSNIEKVETYYRFNLLDDEDDNEFVDCAIASNANCIVSHDKDFEPLRNINFPKVNVIDSSKFFDLLRDNTFIKS